MTYNFSRYYNRCERCGELYGKNRKYPHQCPQSYWQEQVRQLKALLRIVDMAIEDECGGFYLSAPEGSPLALVRDVLRGQTTTCELFKRYDGEVTP